MYAYLWPDFRIALAKQSTGSLVPRCLAVGRRLRSVAGGRGPYMTAPRKLRGSCVAANWRRPVKAGSGGARPPGRSVR